MKRKHFQNSWPFEREIHRSQLDSHHKGPVMQNSNAFYVYLTNFWTNSQDASDLKRQKWHSIDVNVMFREYI